MARVEDVGHRKTRNAAEPSFTIPKYTFGARMKPAIQCGDEYFLEPTDNVRDTYPLCPTNMTTAVTIFEAKMMCLAELPSTTKRC